MGQLAGPFYPESCHGPRLTRRELIAGGVALATIGASGARAAHADDDGGAIVRQWAALPDDPWAVCHGVRALGRDFKLQDGRRAVDWLLETYLVSVTVNGKEVLGFPPSIEVHPNSFLKTFLEAGVPLEHPFTLKDRPRTLREVVDGARALFRPGEVMAQANMLPWSLIAFSRTTSPVRPTWTNAWGEPVDFHRIVDQALRLMEEASSPLAKAMQDDRTESVRAPVHSFTCGGTHMLYGLLAASAAGHAGRDRAERIRRQTDLMVWRLRADLPLIEGFYKERASHAGAYWYGLDSKLKLLGHGEECLAFGAKSGVVKLTDGQQRHRRTAVAALKKIIREMEGRDLSEAKGLDRELFRQLVGDTCHARHGFSFT